MNLIIGNRDLTEIGFVVVGKFSYRDDAFDARDYLIEEGISTVLSSPSQTKETILQVPPDQVDEAIEILKKCGVE